MDDLINRQAALKALEKHEKSNGHNYTLFVDIVAECEEIIRDVPSTQSVEYQWIPCSKQMPEEYEWIGTKEFGTTISDMVHVTFENENGERFVRQIMFQNGKLSRVDQRTIDILYKGSKPIAWCPYPKPWEGDNNE